MMVAQSRSVKQNSALGTIKVARGLLKLQQCLLATVICLMAGFMKEAV